MVDGRVDSRRNRLDSDAGGPRFTLLKGTEEPGADQGVEDTALTMPRKSKLPKIMASFSLT